MNKSKIVGFVAMAAACGLVTVGCEATIHGNAVVEPAGAEVDVNGPPPAPLNDVVVGVAPGPDYIWVGGGWGWVGNRWAWQTGHWGHPPHAGMHWDGGRYEYRNGHHYYHRAGWR